MGGPGATAGDWLTCLDNVVGNWPAWAGKGKQMKSQLYTEVPLRFDPVFVVWVSTTDQWGGSRKTRPVPHAFAARIYPLGSVVAGQPFRGWTFNALLGGQAARWYGAPHGVFTTAAAAEAVAARVRERFLEMLDDAGIPRPSGEEGVDMPF